MSIIFKHKINWMYAFGEILLVVIGILIALQIDNWNEDAKKMRFQVSLLQELQKDLVADTIMLSNQADRIESMLHAVRVLSTMPSYDDSLSYYIGKLEEGVLFTSQNASFETLKSVGVDLIRDNELRRAILGIYRNYEFHDQIVRVSQEEFFNHVWIPFARQYLIHQVRPEDPFQNILIPRDYKSLSLSDDYVDVLNWKLAWYGEYKSRFVNMKTKASQVIEQIEQYVNSI